MKLSPRPRLRTSAAAGVAALALSVTACGGSEPASSDAAPAPSAASSSATSSEQGQTQDRSQDQSPVELIAASADAAREAGSAKVSMRVVTTTDKREISVSGDGVLDTEAGAAHLNLEAQDPQGGETMTMEVIAVDGAVYVKGQPGQAEGKWVRSRLAPGQDGGLAAADPTQSLEMLRSVSDDVKEAGTVQVRGVEATRYTGTIDLAKAAEQRQGGQEGGQEGEKAQQMLKALGVDEVPFEVYLDEDGRPVRIATTMKISLGEQAITTKTTLDLYDWGTEVNITAPDPADVVDAEEVHPTPIPKAG